MDIEILRAELTKFSKEELVTELLAALIELAKVPTKPAPPTRGGPTEQFPDAPYCKPDQSCCDFCCGN